MKENVGRMDQVFRSIAGPALIVLGYSRLGGREGRPVGLVAMIAGTGVVESAITRVCPVNSLLGIDSRSMSERIRERDGRQTGAEGVLLGKGTPEAMQAMESTDTGSRMAE
ncbi:MAG: DUF2892 domain-containing protein [Desulfovibrionales bacterium]